MFIFFIDFLNDELREWVDMTKNAFNQAELILIFSIFLFYIFLFVLKASYFFKVNFMSLVCNHLEVLKDFVNVAFNGFSIKSIESFLFSVLDDLLFELWTVVGYGFFLFVIFWFESTHD